MFDAIRIAAGAKAIEKRAPAIKAAIENARANNIDITGKRERAF
jgi:hypothetical protein